MGFKIEHRTGVAAPVDDVYEVVADIDSWPSWSPIHKSASGELHFGAPVRFEEYYEGLGVWEIGGTIDDWSPLSHIHISVPKRFYEGKLIRYFEFSPLSETGSSFTVGALFDGFLSEREGRRYARFLREGFAAFAEAVKTRSEAAFAEAPAHRAPPEVALRAAPQLGPQRRNWQPTKLISTPGQMPKT